MRMKGVAYRELKIWKECEQLVVDVYSCTGGFPHEEVGGLRWQMRRASVDGLRCLAEVFASEEVAEKLSSLYQARGSVYEVEVQLMLVKRKDLIPIIDLNNTEAQIAFCKRMINGYIAHYTSLLEAQKRCAFHAA